MKTKNKRVRKLMRAHKRAPVNRWQHQPIILPSPTPNTQMSHPQLTFLYCRVSFKGKADPELIPKSISFLIIRIFQEYILRNWKEVRF